LIKLPFVCYDLSNLSDYVQIDTANFNLKRALPSLHFILPGNKQFAKGIQEKTTVGICVPHNLIAEIVRQLGNPIVSTSIHDEDDVIEYTTDPELILRNGRTC
jgi:tRNA A37 threonylcarbamoyladenosine synthetase subunit TsaC/SUA5/YrdC